MIEKDNTFDCVMELEMKKYFKESKCKRLLQTYILLLMLHSYFSLSNHITVEEILIN